MTAVPGDISLDGFGGAVANWNAQQGSRFFRILRASLAPIEVLGIDISVTIATANVANQLVQTGPVAIWRCSIGQKDPPNTTPTYSNFGGGLGSSPLPAGFELLWGKRLVGTFQNATGAAQTMGTEFSFRFPRGTMVAAQGQQLFVSTFQPIQLNGTDIYATGSCGVFMSVMGIDYGLSPVGGGSGIPARSVPRFQR